MVLLENKTTLIGTLGGTVLSVVGIINFENMLQTAVLAAVGAIVSFFVTLLLKRIFRK